MNQLVDARVAQRRHAEHEAERAAIERYVRRDLAAEAHVAEACAKRVAAEDLADRCAAAIVAIELRISAATDEGRVGEAYELRLDLVRAQAAIAEARDAARYAQLAAYGVIHAMGPPEAYSDPNRRNPDTEVAALGQPPETSR